VGGMVTVKILIPHTFGSPAKLICVLG